MKVNSSQVKTWKWILKISFKLKWIGGEPDDKSFLKTKKGVAHDYQLKFKKVFS